MEDINNLKRKQFQHETSTWKRMLDFMQEENIHLKNRLSDVLKESFNKKMLDDVEIFQNNFIKADELIILLKNELAGIEKSLLTKFFVPEEMNRAIEIPIKKMRINIDTAEKHFTKMNNDFNNYLSENLQKQMIRKIAVKNICIAICCFYSNYLQAQLNTGIIKTTVSQNLYFSFTDFKKQKQIQSYKELVKMPLCNDVPALLA